MSLFAHAVNVVNWSYMFIQVGNSERRRVQAAKQEGWRHISYFNIYIVSNFIIK